jgi:hypothetical protein
VVVEAFIACLERRSAPIDATNSSQIFQQALDAVRAR